MTTKRESILVDIASSLAGTVQVGTRIYRSQPLSRGESPAIVKEPVSDTAEQTLRSLLLIVAMSASRLFVGCSARPTGRSDRGRYAQQDRCRPYFGRLRDRRST